MGIKLNNMMWELLKFALSDNESNTRTTRPRLC